MMQQQFLILMYVYRMHSSVNYFFINFNPAQNRINSTLVYLQHGLLSIGDTTHQNMNVVAYALPTITKHFFIHQPIVIIRVN